MKYVKKFIACFWIVAKLATVLIVGIMVGEGNIAVAMVLCSVVLADAYLFSKGFGNSLFHEVRRTFPADLAAYKKATGEDWEPETKL